MQTQSKVRKLTDLEAWKAAHDLTIDVYTITKKFSKEEMFGVTSQVRRAAISIGSNIAEGFSRHTPKNKAPFYTIAKGSATELENQLLLSKDIGVIRKVWFWDGVKIDQGGQGMFENVYRNEWGIPSGVSRRATARE